MATMTDEKSRTELNTIREASAELSKGMRMPGGSGPFSPAGPIAYGNPLELSLLVLYQTRTALGALSNSLLRYSVASPKMWKSRLYQAFRTASGSSVAITAKLAWQGCGARCAPAAT